MKTCRTCKTEKDEAEFSKNNGNKDGLHYYCKSCMREYRLTDAVKASQKEYQQSDAFKEYQKAYAQTDVRKEYLKAYQQTDAYKKYQNEHKMEYQKAYRLRKKAEATGNAGQSSDTQTLGGQE